MSNHRLVNASLRTDVGQIRDHNEDFVVCREPADAAEASTNGWLYIVADGVGGADAGEVASHYAAEQTVHHYLQNSQQENWGRRLVDAMQAANTDLRRMVAERNDNSRMATTMVAVVIDDHKAHIANVGDSRGYLWRQGTLEQITKDQSLVAKLLEEGAITEQEAENHPRRNVILYSLGSERSPKIDLFERFLEPGDIILLCSDGLTRHVSDTELADHLNEQADIDQVTQTLIDLANNRGGQDNISVGLLQFWGDEDMVTANKAVLAGEKTQVTSKTAVSADPPTKSLWGFTLALAGFQTFLIVILWAILFT